MPGMEGSGNVIDAGNANDGLGGAWIDREVMEPSGRILSLLWWVPICVPYPDRLCPFESADEFTDSVDGSW